ncbi:hypothetical protein [Caulobacter sp. Root487D2Y]|uniref:hypothetical protein n=1 Tax=Caulobacter sp. Root487D2Y TaxID=1736547 RepID=UPI0012E36AB4|nr:hypothetical protein [Caulobacter sp. Root487D2Y]
MGVKQNVSPRRYGLKERQAEERYEQIKSAHLLRRKGLPAATQEAGYVNQGERLRRKAVLIRPPAHFSLTSNYDESLGFVYDWTWLAYSRDPEISSGFMSIDLAGLKSITLDAALVLVSEYHRALIQYPAQAPWIDDSGWPVFIRSLLDELGFYNLVSARGRSCKDDTKIDFGQRFVPFISGEEVEGQQVDDLLNRLEEAAGRAPRRKATYGAIVEAMKNVRSHAYPPDAHEGLAPRVPRWWAAGAYDMASETLIFSMYDQGVGIPVTLKPKRLFQAIRDLCPPEFNDADVLAGAIEYGRTSTDLQGRGNGLWTICRLATELDGSSVRLLSGRGEVTYSSRGRVRKKLHGNAFCGTLVQWILKLPPDETEELK